MVHPFIIEYGTMWNEFVTVPENTGQIGTKLEYGTIWNEYVTVSENTGHIETVLEYGTNLLRFQKTRDKLELP